MVLPQRDPLVRHPGHADVNEAAVGVIPGEFDGQVECRKWQAIECEFAFAICLGLGLERDQVAAQLNPGIINKLTGVESDLSGDVSGPSSGSKKQHRKTEKGTE